MDQYYSSEQTLGLYQRLIQYWTMTFNHPNKIHVLDHMNFNSAVFPPALTLAEIERATLFEPGYASPDGSIEVEPVIKYLELQRLHKFRPDQRPTNQRVIDNCGVGAGNGTTNAMNGVLNALIRLPEYQKRNKHAEIIFCIPNYSVYEAQAAQLANMCKPVFAHGKRENNFLLTLDEIVRLVNPDTLAIIVTYPNNPAQSTYEHELSDEIVKIAQFCRDNEIFLIVDNVYQDSMYPNHARRHVEILGLFDTPDFMIKLFGPSKDTAFFPGYRFGYWIGDGRIQDNYRYHISATENTLGTVGLVMGSCDCLFRAKRQFLSPFTIDDMELFNTGLFGWGRKFNKERLFDNFSNMQLFEKYNLRVDRADSLMEEANDHAMEFIKQSPVFCDYVNSRIGNVFFARVDPAYFPGDDDQLFRWLLEHGVGILPGNVFGLPIKPGSTWMRFTLIHDYWQNIIKGLEIIEHALIRNHNR